jgi:hypothetical protein
MSMPPYDDHRVFIRFYVKKVKNSLKLFYNNIIRFGESFLVGKKPP